LNNGVASELHCINLFHTSRSFATLVEPVLLHHHLTERKHIRLQVNQNAHQHRQRDAVEENVAQNVSFGPYQFVAVLAIMFP
jgi:hypothetical protein